MLAGAPPVAPYMVGDIRPKFLRARTQCAFPAALLQGLQNAPKPLTLSQAHLDWSVSALVHTKLWELIRLLRSCLGSQAETHQEYHWLLPSPWLVAGIMSAFLRLSSEWEIGKDLWSAAQRLGLFIMQVSLASQNLPPSTPSHPKNNLRKL